MQSIAPVEPPAKKTNPDGNDAAAKKRRPCPRPWGYLDQLLLVSLYMSTNDDASLPESNTSAQPRPYMRTRLLKQQAVYKSARCSRSACLDRAAPVKPPAKKTNPDGNDAAAKLNRACPRPWGYLDQLLLVSLYMSTNDDA